MGLLTKLGLGSAGLKPKLIGSFVVVALLVGVTGAIGYQGVGSVNSDLDRIVENDVEMADASMEMKFQLESQRLALHEVITGEQEAAEEFRESSEKFTEWHGQLTALDDLSPEEARLLEELATEQEEANVLGEAVIAAMAAGDTERANQRMDELDSIYAEMEEDTITFEESATANMAASIAEARSTTTSAQMTVFGLTAGAFILATGIGLLFNRHITPPLKQLSDSAVAISDGSLQTEISDREADDEIGQMLDAFTRMQNNLNGVFSDLGTVSRNLKDGTVQQAIETEYPGTYGDIMRQLDDGTDELAGSFDEIEAASEAISEGDLDREIETDRPGQYGSVLRDFATGTEQLAASFEQISRASSDLKNGRLDQQIDDSYPGEYGRVLTNLEDGVAQLRDSIGTVQDVANEVASASQQVSASTAEIETASEDVANSVEGISQGTDQQSDDLQAVASEMNDMSATVEEVAASAEEVSSTASTAVDQGETGRRHAAAATAEIEAIESRADAAASQVQALDTEMDQIGEIVEMISDIAEQTNMLALNASIEAARAGEAGEGFGVVADEIKSLAEEAGNATMKIETRIDEIQSATGDTVEDIEGMSDRVQSGAETIENAVTMFDEIADAIQQAEAGIREISEATDDQAASSEEVVSMVDEVSAVSGQTAAEATNVSAATEEQASSLSEATTNIQQLSSLAEELHDNVADFEVARSAAPTMDDETDIYDPDDAEDRHDGDAGPAVLGPDSDVTAPLPDGGVESDSDAPRAQEQE